MSQKKKYLIFDIYKCLKNYFFTKIFNLLKEIKLPKYLQEFLEMNSIFRFTESDEIICSSSTKVLPRYAVFSYRDTEIIMIDENLTPKVLIYAPYNVYSNSECLKLRRERENTQTGFFRYDIVRFYVSSLKL